MKNPSATIERIGTGVWLLTLPGGFRCFGTSREELSYYWRSIRLQASTRRGLRWLIRSRVKRQATTVAEEGDQAC